MKTFRCHCGNILHFENSQCLKCGRLVGFVPELGAVSAFEPAGGDQWQALSNGRLYRQCDNYSRYQVCNWMVPQEDAHPYCCSCRLNHIIPNLNDPQNLTLWYRIESAKRRLLYTLYMLRLPVVGRGEDGERGLAFKFMADPSISDEFSSEFSQPQQVFTGHRTGMITINILEAEHGAREQMREKMNERYRTLLGHFRHESGHYYWERLVAGTDALDGFRKLFGDERLDYQQALDDYHAHGPAQNWEDAYISAYASMHPWEDWAETWAHYLHIVDTLETAQDYGFSIQGRDVCAPTAPEPGMFGDLMEDWLGLSAALNALNRSMGMADAYPFSVSHVARDKLRFIHDLIMGAAVPGTGRVC